jgi:hypothetical protein
VRLPDHQATPGAIASTDVVVICQTGYPARARHVTAKTKRDVLQRYRMTPSATRAYEIDHVIPLALGGSNDISNLFPQPYFEHPGAHEKDWLEVELRRRVCRGQMAIHVAQECIRDNWWTCYVETKKETP